MKRLVPVLFLLSLCACRPLENVPMKELALSVAPPSPKGDSLLNAPGPLTMARLLEAARLNNPTLAEAAVHVAEARMQYYQMLGAYFPTIEARFSLNDGVQDWTQRINPFADDAPHEHHFSTATGFHASYLLLDALAREFRVLAGREKIRENEELQRNAERTLTFCTASTCLDVLLARENSRIHRADVLFQRSNLFFARSRLTSGGAAMGEVLNFQLLEGRARSRERESIFQEECASYALSALLGNPDFPLLDHAGELELEEPPDLPLPEEDFCMDQAIRCRPDLRAVRSALIIAHYDRYRAMGSFLPTIRLFADFTYRTEQAMFGDFTQSYQYLQGPSFTYGGTVQWVLFSGLARLHALKEREEALKGAGFRLYQIYLQVVREVRTALAACRNCQEQCRIYRQLRQWAQEQRDLTVTQYRAGHVNVTRLNETQTDLIQAQSRFLASLIQWHRARFQLESAVAGQLFTDSVLYGSSSP